MKNHRQKAITRERPPALVRLVTAGRYLESWGAHSEIMESLQRGGA
jgi:hypothetical protein